VAPIGPCRERSRRPQYCLFRAWPNISPALHGIADVLASVMDVAPAGLIPTGLSGKSGDPFVKYRYRRHADERCICRRAQLRLDNRPTKFADRYHTNFNAKYFSLAPGIVPNGFDPRRAVLLFKSVSSHITHHHHHDSQRRPITRRSFGSIPSL